MPRIPAILLILAALLVSPTRATPDPAPEPTELLVGRDYPLEVSVAFHKALLHWLDSLTLLVGAGLSAGKTVAAHHDEYRRVIGAPSEADRAMLERYRRVRRGWVQSAAGSDRDGLTHAFLEATDLNDALARAQRLLDDDDARGLAEAVRHFEPRYRRIWRDGRVPRAWVERVRNSRRREELAAFLVGVARLFDVPPTGEPRPQLVLAPVPAGHGTHAQAIGRYLLIEIRPGEGLADEAAPIVHENVHLLMNKIPPERMATLERAASQAASHGAEAWATLKEALPTAIAQGIADRRFRSDHWSLKHAWYHSPPVDGYAKRIYPLVRQALKDGARLDAALVRRLAQAYRPAP